MKRLLDWFDERTGYRELLRREVTGKVAPAHRGALTYMSCFGGLTLVLFVLQAISGVFLLVHYTPHVDQAFESVRHINDEVPYGWLVRRAHAVGGSLMVVTVLVHALKVFFTGAYKPPRELHWMTGAFLLLMTLAMGFSGILLPWSQLSYWASTVGTEAARSAPLIGESLVHFIRGSEKIDQNTLGRFFALHVAILPGAMALFMAGHFFMIRKTGIARPL